MYPMHDVSAVNRLTQKQLHIDAPGRDIYTLFNYCCLCQHSAEPASRYDYDRPIGNSNLVLVWPRSL